MARMYFTFKTNLKPTEDDICTPQVDYIAFENEEAGLHISVSCNWESDYGIRTPSNSRSTYYNARFKGLEIAVETINGETIHEYEDMTKEDFELLKGCNIYEMGIYIPEYDKYMAGEKFTPTCKNLTVDIFLNDAKLSFEEKNVPVMEYGD